MEGLVGARVLHLHSRRPQGPRRHGAADRRLRLPDPAPGRCRPGRDRSRRGLQDQGVHRDAAPRRGRQPEPEPDRARRGEEVRHQARPRALEAWPGDRPARAGADRRGLRGRGGDDPDPLGAQVRARVGHLPGVLRARDGDRLDGRAGRRRRDHRRAVDRRARHAADHAHLPHRRRGRPRHHAGSAARRRAVRGAQAEGPGADGDGRRQGRRRGVRQGHQGDRHRPKGRGRGLHLPGADPPLRQARRADRGGHPAQRGLAVSRRPAARSAAAPRPSSTCWARSRRSTRCRASTSTTSTSS